MIFQRKYPFLKKPLLTPAISSLVFTQTSGSNNAKIKTDETISYLLRDSKNARGLIKKQKIRIADLETEGAVERENSASVSKSYEAAKTEIDLLKKSNAAYERAIAANEQTISLLQTGYAKQNEKAKRATKVKWKAYGVAAVAVAIKFLIP
jgi:hypothetical protein